MINQAHVTIDELDPGPGFVLQAAIEKLAVEVAEGHVQTSQERRSIVEGPRTVPVASHAPEKKKGMPSGGSLESRDDAGETDHRIMIDLGGSARATVHKTSLTPGMPSGKGRRPGCPGGIEGRLLIAGSSIPEFRRNW
jgi:hypothetical protein